MSNVQDVVWYWGKNNLRQRKKISSGKERLELDIPVRCRQQNTNITQGFCTEKPNTTDMRRLGHFDLKSQLIHQVKKPIKAGMLRRKSQAQRSEPAQDLSPGPTQRPWPQMCVGSQEPSRRTCVGCTSADWCVFIPCSTIIEIHVSSLAFNYIFIMTRSSALQSH